MQQSQTNSGIGLTGLLFITLIILKVMGYIGMSWFWVLTSIVWIPLSIIAAWLGFLGLLALMAILGALLADLVIK